jgi:endonuclease G
MTGRLSHELIEQLVQTVIRNGLYNRSILLANISADVVGSMDVLQDGSPRVQLLRDLYYLNKPYGLMDRADPLESWLINAIASAGRPSQREVFEHVLHGLRDPGQPQLRVFRRSFEPGGGTGCPPITHPSYLELALPPDKGVAVQFLKEGQRAAESVALISVTRFDGREVNDRWMQAIGTGWLIGPRMVITAFHVVNARQDGEPSACDEDFTEQAHQAKVTFGYDEAGQPGSVISVSGVLARSSAHDYVIFELETDPGVPPLRLAGDGPAADSNAHPALNIIRHSLAGPKALAIRDNVATTLGERPGELGYFTATATGGGACGAPIFDDDWHVVALHRASRHVDGTMPHAPQTACVNIGTKITAIRDDLQSRSPSVWNRISEGQISRMEFRGQLTLSTNAEWAWESTDELRKKIHSIAAAYETDTTFWLWDKEQLRDEIRKIRQQLDERCGPSSDADRDSSSLRFALNQHGTAVDQLVEVLDELQVGTPPAQRSVRSCQFKRRGATWLERLARIQEELPGTGRLPPDPG